ncbi:MarR family winged helix-turn-helix transcriptional regulator [Kineosporia sp. NBRC 101731]|uniref:MarR family winged helix-turn-helix transcriptional regulator n=1 Tax=Kineosporia sp. NBRC 101731 TaxID=3032199 RepID=UPI0024A3FA9F|nr:MarR family winged helix-turn-helix transcriptional regulator [Kineosporia sp. NBRC 101731]GLY29509.1 MarR family transcriptional regulator [Kineosporia sp. NBRC 101731]
MAKPRTLKPEEWELWHTWMQAQRLLARELDRGLQRDYGISKAEFSVLVSLHQAPEGKMRVGELAESLAWEKSRVSHQLTRMENRDLVTRTDSGGRRSGIELTAQGRSAAQAAILGHAENIRRYFFETLTPEQTSAIQGWSQQVVGLIEGHDGDGPE